MHGHVGILNLDRLHIVVRDGLHGRWDDWVFRELLAMNQTAESLNCNKCHLDVTAEQMPSLGY